VKIEYFFPPKPA